MEDKDRLRYALPSFEHERIYRALEEEEFSGTSPAPYPVAVILGGQPASGKSKLITLAEKEFPDGNAVTINGDEYRALHPQAEEILKLHESRFAELTDPDSRVWTKRLFDRCIETRRNIVFEGTMRVKEPIAETMERLLDAGYAVEARVMAVHARHTVLGASMRFEGQKAVKGHGRAVPRDSHDAAYQAMPGTVGYLQERKLCGRLCVYDIAHQKIYDNRLENGGWIRPEKAEDVIHEIRALPLSAEGKRDYERDAARLLRMMRERGAPQADIAATLETLKPFLEEERIPLPALPERDTGIKENAGLTLRDRAVKYAIDTYPGDEEKQRLLTEAILDKAREREYGSGERGGDRETVQAGRENEAEL